MTFELFGCEIYISVPFTAFIALLFLTDKTGMMSITALAVIIHELGHIAAMKLLSAMPRRIELKPAVLHIIKPKGALSYKKEIAILAAGPLAGAITAAISAAMYFFADKNEMFLWFCTSNMALTAFNMLPISELDGGKILEYVLSIKLTSESAKRISLAVSCIFIAILITVGAVMLLYGYNNLTVLITGLYMLILMLLKLRK